MGKKKGQERRGREKEKGTRSRKKREDRGLEDTKENPLCIFIIHSYYN